MAQSRLVAILVRVLEAVSGPKMARQDAPPRSAEQYPCYA